MGKKIRVVLMILLLAVFIGSGWVIFSNMRQYKEEREYYDQTSKKYVREKSPWVKCPSRWILTSF